MDFVLSFCFYYKKQLIKLWYHENFSYDEGNCKMALMPNLVLLWANWLFIEQ